MVDHLSAEMRSWNMAQIKGKDTKLEVLVRSMLHRAGYRFRKNVKDLPGTPDIVLPKYRTVIFVHGCFWHRHKGCKGAAIPKTRTEWWEKKFERNVCNDRKNSRALRKLGWHVITVWTCEIEKNSERVFRKFRHNFLLSSDFYYLTSGLRLGMSVENAGAGFPEVGKFIGHKKPSSIKPQPKSIYQRMNKIYE